MILTVFFSNVEFLLYSEEARWLYTSLAAKLHAF
jgi:hypothetical protein